MYKIIIFQLGIVIFSTFLNGYYTYNNESNGIVRYPTLENIIKEFGYPYENHTMYTDDGWILTIGRIPFKSRRVCGKKRGTIILAPGIYTNGALFVYQGPQKSLGLILSDMCYDVWLYNARGTRYAKHRNYTLSDEAYWSYSFDELAVYDTSALIKYVTNATGDNKIQYIGYSQGSSQIIALLATKPEYQKHILSAQLLAPVAYTTNFQLNPKWFPYSVVAQLSQQAPELVSRPFPDDKGILQDMLFDSCIPRITEVCHIIMDSFFAGVRDPQWVVHFPDLISMRVLAHFIQLHVYDKVHMFDYGAKKNLGIYGSEQPPFYEIEKIRCPVYIYNALGDGCSTPLDVKRLAQRLPNLKATHFINRTDFTHQSFNNFYDNTTELLNRHLFASLGQYD